MDRSTMFLLLALLVNCNAAAAEKLQVAAPPPNDQSDLLAFSADLSMTTEYGPGSNIVYDRVHSNVGGLYFGTSGQFMCPEGVYVFIWNMLKAPVSELLGMRCIGSLSSEGLDLKYGPKTSYIDMGFSSTSEMTAIHACNTTTPAAVTVKSQPWAEEIGSTTVYRANYATFSGFKLQAGIAFTAELSQDLNIVPGSRIMFNNILANYGGHFELVHGSFRCPDAGVYVFSMSTYTRDPMYPWSVSRLMMEMETILQGPITFRATEAYDSGSASTTAVVQCTLGFSVYLEAQAAHDFTMNSYGAALTSFTGFKLYDASAETVAFTVVMNQNVTISTAGQVIDFDEVITNIGGAFDTINSMFVCPDEAHYMFTWSIATADGATHIDLQMDGSIVKHNYAKPPSSADDTGTSGSSAMSVIWQCQPGSFFYIACRHDNEKALGGFVSFSGYKLPG